MSFTLKYKIQTITQKYSNEIVKCASEVNNAGPQNECTP